MNMAGQAPRGSDHGLRSGHRMRSGLRIGSGARLPAPNQADRLMRIRIVD